MYDQQPPPQASGHKPQLRKHPDGNVHSLGQGIQQPQDDRWRRPGAVEWQHAHGGHGSQPNPPYGDPTLQSPQIGQPWPMPVGQPQWNHVGPSPAVSNPGPGSVPLPLRPGAVAGQQDGMLAPPPPPLPGPFAAPLTRPSNHPPAMVAPPAYAAGALPQPQMRPPAGPGYGHQQPMAGHQQPMAGNDRWITSPAMESREHVQPQQTRTTPGPQWYEMPPPRPQAQIQADSRAHQLPYQASPFGHNRARIAQTAEDPYGTGLGVPAVGPGGGLAPDVLNSSGTGSVGGSSNVLGGGSRATAGGSMAGSNTNIANSADEGSLLEELGIYPAEIGKRILSVVFWRRWDSDIIGQLDLTGPVLILLTLGICLLMTGKVHFGYIYALSSCGSLGLWALLNLMSENAELLDFYRTLSILGYSLIPLVLLAISAVFVPLRNAYGLIASLIAILWSAGTASRFFTTALLLKSQQALVAYPVFLFYTTFALLTVF